MLPPVRLPFIFRTLALVILLLTLHSASQSSYQPSPENLQARREFQDMKFGMFIHWGVYSVLGDGEWVFHDRHLKLDEYNRLPAFFDPEKFDAKTWVSGQSRRHEVHHHHFAPSRRLRHVRLESLRLEHRRPHTL